MPATLADAYMSEKKAATQVSFNSVIMAASRCHWGPVPLRRVVFVEVGETVRPKKEMLFRKGG